MCRVSGSDPAACDVSDERGGMDGGDGGARKFNGPVDGAAMDALGAIIDEEGKSGRFAELRDRQQPLP